MNRREALKKIGSATLGLAVASIGLAQTVMENNEKKNEDTGN